MIDLTKWAEALGLRRKRTFRDRIQDAADEVVDSLAETVYPIVSKSQTAMHRGADRLGHTVVPLIERSGKAAKGTLGRTAMTATAGLAAATDAATDLAEDAASAVASTAATTGVAAAGAATGLAAFFAGVFSWLWWMVKFLVKTALLVGVAYVGWQWLQSRREQQNWDARTPVQPSSMYGTVSGSTESTTPASAGLR
jgi:hypothetical protein